MNISVTSFIKIISLVSVTLFIVSCATLNKDECKNANWQVIGYEDGSSGYPASRVGEHRKACAEYGITPDLNLYNKGRAEGLHKYCIPHNGYRIGLRGGVYKGICVGYQEQIFIAAFKYGKKIYLAKQDYANLKSTLTTKQTELEHIAEDIHRNDDAIAGNKITATEAVSIHEETEHLQEKHATLDREIQNLKDEITAQGTYISDLERHNTY